MTNVFQTYVVAAAVTLAAATATASAAGQAGRPSFTGVWTYISAPPKPGSGGGSEGGSAALKPEPITIRHSATSIAIERSAFGQKNTLTFTIGGAKDDTNRTGAQVWTTKTRWEGNKLVTTGNIAQNTSAGFEEWTYTETRSLDPRGHMIIETRYVAGDGKVSTGKQDWAPVKAPAPEVR